MEARNGRPTVFLNLDGVLHPVGVEYNFRREAPPPVPPFAWAEALRPLTEKWNLSFVLRTSATLLRRGELLPELAPAWLWSRVAGACDDKYRYLTLDWVRKVNTSYGVIRRYVDKHELSNWVALDDEDDGWPADPSVRTRLVVCNPEEGVRDPALLKRLDEALKAVCDAARV